jgi:hypothetical protein
MSDIAILREMINETAVISLEDDPQGYNKKNPKKQVTLTEPGPPSYSVTIRNMPDNAIIIKADAFPALTTVFANSRGECKRADFVIVADTDEKKVIVCIEMKAQATTSTTKKIIQQLKGAQCFVAYCQAIGKVFWGQKNFLDSYVYRFICFSDIISMPKRSTRNYLKTTGTGDSPEQLLKYSEPRPPDFFKDLVGKISKK